MVALAQRIIKLEKKLANRSQTGHLRGNVVYQPSDQEWAAAMEILVAVGAMIPPVAIPSASTIATGGIMAPTAKIGRAHV